MNRLRAAVVGVGVVVALGGGLGAGVRTTYGGHAAVDEPEYLLTALSLAEDRDLSIADELAEDRQRPFHDAPLPVQTRELRGGRRVSPHDPLLPALVALPMAVGGFVAVKLTLAAMGGVLAALLAWTAVRAFDVPLGTAAAGALLVGLSPPMAVYATQVYPEMPAALVTLAAVAALTRGPSARATAVAVGGVVLLPWLSVKYVPVAGAIAAVVAWRLARARAQRELLVSGLVVVLAAIGYLAAHRLLYGGWTSYATGDHFQATGEFSVVGVRPDYVGRSTRLVALLTDREFGLVAWQPLWLLAVPATAAAVARRVPHALPTVLPLAAGWLTATFLALTMHGFWWPGRQVVVVLPCAALLVLAWVAGRAARTRLLVALGTTGCIAYAWLLVDGWRRELTWVSGFAGVGDPIYAGLRAVLPDYRDPGARTWALHAIWVAVLLLLAARAASPRLSIPRAKGTIT